MNSVNTKLKTDTLIKLSASLYNQNAEKIGEIELNPKIFGIPFSPDLVHQVVLAQEANSRQTVAHTKDRAEVRGGGKKPWKQKGTGRARHGSIRSPIWKGGGVTFGPRKERVFAKKINKKMKRKALFCVLSQKLNDKEITFIDNLEIINIKTKEAAVLLKKFDKAGKSIMLILPKKNEGITRAFLNIPKIKTILADSLNARDLLKYKYIFILKEALPVIEKTYLFLRKNCD